ncbi:hypothetical protein [Nonomuraea zeae]|uniref:Uncharacterized protein n=1 Tax=Nonomuraea zeae TaxID=1642303 RepID=A0A5S4GW80_9ACTN|nr:hypothetical protein [Nonomuraea zeae]TMR30720.1 hypothetical protein ETD85_28090 [Nonomuraea zeae]
MSISPGRASSRTAGPGSAASGPSPSIRLRPSAGARSCFLWALDYDESQVALAEAVALGERPLRLVPDRRGREHVVSGVAGLRFRRFTATVI